MTDANQLREVMISAAPEHGPKGLPLLVYPPCADCEYNSFLIFSIIGTVELTPNSSVFALWGTQPEEAVKRIGI